MDNFAAYPIPAGAPAYGGACVPRRTAARRTTTRRVRGASVALSLSRLEREHVALLLAMCELEGPRRSDDDTPQAMRDALLLLLRDDLRQTQRALGFAARGTYGICEECHRPLPGRLLEQRPATTRCLSCASRSATSLAD
ncbi:MAG: TraR/DksA C4-type zinc finger protein [Ktedonobacterales bacterium]